MLCVLVLKSDFDAIYKSLTLLK